MFRLLTVGAKATVMALENRVQPTNAKIPSTAASGMGGYLGL